MSATNPADSKLSTMKVIITGADPVAGRVMCRNPFGFEFEIDGTNRIKGSGFPSENETWILTRVGNIWIPETQIGAAAPPQIEGSRIGLSDVVIQLLEAAAASGLVVDNTDAIIADVVVEPNIIDPSEVIPDPVDPADGSGIADIVEYAPIPVEDGPAFPTVTYLPPVVAPDVKPVKPPKTPAKPAPKPAPTKNKWYPLYMGSYNTLKDLGPSTAYSDLLALNRTRLQIVGLQEAHNDNRDAGFARLAADHGWSRYRPKTGAFSDENTIIWRTDDFKLLDSGCIGLGQYSIPSALMPPRYLNWVKLTHRDSSRNLYFMDTHFDPFLDNHDGHPRTAANLQARIQMHYGFIATIASKMRSFGASAPVFTAGDFNINLIDDAKVRYPKFPYAAWGDVDTRSNWDSIKERPSYGTIGGNLYYDSIWATRPVHWNVKPESDWILTGYHSDHKPVVVKYQIKSLN